MAEVGPLVTALGYRAAMTDVSTFLQVTGTLNRYFRLLDERSFEVERFAEVFDATGLVLRPNGTSLTGPGEIVESHRSSFARFSATQHLLTGHDVETTADGATVRANLVAVHLWAKNSDGVIHGADDVFVAGAVIVAAMTDSGHGWRIDRLTNTTVWKAGSGFASMAATLGRP